MKLKLSLVTRHLSLVTNKLSLTMVLTLFLSAPLAAQMTIGKDSIPHVFSVLELSTEKKKGGLRLPQLNNVQRDYIKNEILNLLSTGNTNDKEIADAAEGLVIYNYQESCMEFWNGEEWIGMYENALGSLSVSPKSILFAYNSFTGSITENITITTNQQGWVFNITGADAACFSAVKSGSNTLTVSTLSNNPDHAVQRVATVNIISGGVVESVTVTQDKNP